MLFQVGDHSEDWLASNSLRELVSAGTGTSSSEDAAAGAGSARAAATGTDTARVLEEGREGGHSVDCIGLPRRASACHQT